MPSNKASSVENSKYRVTIIPDETAFVLKNWITKNMFRENDYIFQYNDKAVRQEYAEKEFRRAIKKAGIITENRKLSPHALRYTYITRTRRLVDTSMTMLMAGHTTEAMADYYTRFELYETVKQLAPIKGKVNSFFN